MIQFRPVARLDKAAAIIFISENQAQKKGFPQIKDPDLAGSILTLNKTKQFTGEKRQLFPFFRDGRILLLAGVGKQEDLSLTSLRALVRNAALSVFLKHVKDIEIIPHVQNDGMIRAVIEGLLIGTYSWKKYQSELKKDEQIENKTLFLAAARKKIFDDTIVISQSVNYARDLINDNADLITAEYFEKEIKAIVKGQKNISVEILGPKELKAKGLNLHLAVNQGSQKEPRLIIVTYKGAASKGNFTAVVGKGITFDTGGLNLKPSGHLETMRSDMSGAAAVVGILKNVLSLRLKKNIILACALAENAIGSRSYKPGDIIRSYNGKTVEIGNTDAEGRLVLADALSYIVRNYKPARLIDIATLTGACVVALGYDYSGLMTLDDRFAGDIIRASNETDDKAWRLPCYPELKEAVKSEVADIKNISNQRGAGGTITAGEFLRQFTENTPWAHIDIAGTAFMEQKAHGYFDYGATGAGVRLLTEYLRNH